MKFVFFAATLFFLTFITPEVNPQKPIPDKIEFSQHIVNPIEVPRAIPEGSSVMITTFFQRSQYNMPEIGGNGSGLILNADGRTLVLTNRHVCLVNESLIKLRTIYPEIIFMKTVRTQDGGFHFAEILKISKRVDLCLMEIHTYKPKNKIKIAKKEPQRGEEVYVVGYPGGYWFGSPLIQKGAVLGIIPPEETSNLLGIPIVPGSSGSPVYNKKGELAGLIWGYVPTAHMLGISISVKELREFLLP